MGPGDEVDRELIHREPLVREAHATSNSAIGAVSEIGADSPAERDDDDAGVNEAEITRTTTITIRDDVPRRTARMPPPVRGLRAL